jgi:tRNA-Thr(GGU) m(6)t(6)A37 methyltransferase TsaA
MKIEINVIGTIHSPFTELACMPIQPVGAAEVVGEVVLDEAYAEGLKDLDGFSHIYLLYFFHKAARTEMQVVPFLDTEKRGVFATRTPMRPSHLGLSVVELLEVNNNRLKIRGVDILDNTPLIDIKPYVHQFDYRENATSGWMKASAVEIARKRSDDRFIEKDA